MLKPFFIPSTPSFLIGIDTLDDQMKGTIATFFRFLFSFAPMKPHFFGIYKRLFLPLNAFDGVTKPIKYRNKFKLSLDLDDWICQNLYFLGTYEESEIRFLENTLKTGDVFIDVGANIGIFSLVASAAVGSIGKVYSFEPFSSNYDKLENHVSINSIKNIKAKKLALSDRSGEITLHTDRHEKNNGMATAYPASSTYFEPAGTVTLDEFALSENLEKISVIKIDIEGGEFPALLGMKEILKKQHPMLIIEADPEILRLTPYHSGQIDSFLSDLSYKKMRLDLNGNLTDNISSAGQSHNYIFI